MFAGRMKKKPSSNKTTKKTMNANEIVKDYEKILEVTMEK